jgi:hypothetical protein
MVQECFGALEEWWIPLGLVKTCPSTTRLRPRCGERRIRLGRRTGPISNALAPRSLVGPAPAENTMRAIELYLLCIATNACFLASVLLAQRGLLSYRLVTLMHFTGIGMSSSFALKKFKAKRPRTSPSNICCHQGTSPSRRHGTGTTDTWTRYSKGRLLGMPSSCRLNGCSRTSQSTL